MLCAEFFLMQRHTDAGMNSPSLSMQQQRRSSRSDDVKVKDKNDCRNSDDDTMVCERAMWSPVSPSNHTESAVLSFFSSEVDMAPHRPCRRGSAVEEVACIPDIGTVDKNRNNPEILENSASEKAIISYPSSQCHDLLLPRCSSILHMVPEADYAPRRPYRRGSVQHPIPSGMDIYSVEGAGVESFQNRLPRSSSILFPFPEEDSPPARPFRRGSVVQDASMDMTHLPWFGGGNWDSMSDLSMASQSTFFSSIVDRKASMNDLLVNQPQVPNSSCYQKTASMLSMYSAATKTGNTKEPSEQDHCSFAIYSRRNLLYQPATADETDCLYNISSFFIPD
jgi:hypothetical protein